jgi:hypothetical protein
MSATGVLLHTYHLEAQGWEDLMWGYPDADRFGTLPKLADTLLDIPATDEVTSIIFSGPSSRDGRGEGACTKDLLLERIEQLDAFPTLAERLGKLSLAEQDVFEQRLRGLIVGTGIRDTADEIATAALFFSDVAPVDRVYHVAVPSHAPRCLQNRLAAEHSKLIAPRQPWDIRTSDVFFMGTTPEDIVVLEPPHRGDDPMVGYSPMLPEAIKPFFGMNPDAKKALITRIAEVTLPPVES